VEPSVLGQRRRYGRAHRMVVCTSSVSLKHPRATTTSLYKRIAAGTALHYASQQLLHLRLLVLLLPAVLHLLPQRYQRERRHLRRRLVRHHRRQRPLRLALHCRRQVPRSLLHHTDYAYRQKILISCLLWRFLQYQRRDGYSRFLQQELHRR